MRRILWTFAGAAAAIGLACGSFGADDPARAPETPDASVDAKPASEPDAGDIIIPDNALDSGAGSVDATAQGSTYGAAVLLDVPLAYWRMNLDDHGVVPNVMQNGLALVPNDLAKVVPASGALTNETDGALELEDGFLATANSALYDFSGKVPFTAECWAKLTGTITEPVSIISKATPSSFLLFFKGIDGYTLVFEQNSPPSVFYGNATSVKPQATGTVQLDTWHHYAIVVDDAVRLFIDGEQRAQSNAAAGTAPSEKAKTPFRVGAVSGSDTTPRFPGIVDEVALYAKALSITQLKAHVAAATAHR